MKSHVFIALGSAIVGGLVVHTLEPAPVVSHDARSVSIEDTPARTSQDRAERPHVDSPASPRGPGVAVRTDPRLPAAHVQLAPQPKSPERLRREAMAAQFPSSAWRAQHGSDEEKAQARRSIARRKRLDDILASEPPAAQATTELLVALERITEGSDVHVLEGECGQTMCKVELIHENDLDALDFHPDRIASAKDWPSDVFVDRSEEDGKIHHTLYYQDPHHISQARKDAAAEMQRQLEIMAQSAD